jgi:hypothetical protein
MKRRLSSLFFITIFMILPIAVWATEVTVWEISDTDTKVLYYGTDGNSFPVAPTDGLPTGWNSNPNFADSGWPLAFLYQDPAWLDPSSTEPFNEAGAEWISINGNGKGPDNALSDGSRGVYLYRKTFQVPATAYNISGDVALASDNYGWLYLNGEEVLAPLNIGQNQTVIKNFTPTPSMAEIPVDKIDKLVCNNVLAAEVQNGCGNCASGGSNIANGVTGVIYSLKLNYELPDVVWQPPVTNSNFSLKNGSTLPLKFNLYTQDGALITSMQEISLAIHKGKYVEPLGDIVAGWILGKSVKYLRFDKGGGQYIANFQTNKMGLEDGWYTAVVHDGCTKEALGYIEFELSSQKNSNRGNKPPKSPKK